MRFFKYSGSKFKYTDKINSLILTDKKIFIEPFIGSGAVLFNLKKEFNEYIINDKDRNIIRIYKTFKEIDFEFYKNELNFIKEKFGSLILKEDIKAKENYYNFRNWFNKNYWKTETNKEGVYLHILANSCINSFFRFGPNGMNQSFGNRFYFLDEKTFNHISKVLKKVKIYNTDYKEILEIYKNSAFYFIDPPYFSQKSSYYSFSENEYIEFLNQIKNKEVLYTDILNNYNKIFKDKELIREIISTSPKNPGLKKNNFEYYFKININKNKTKEKNVFF